MNLALDLANNIGALVGIVIAVVVVIIAAVVLGVMMPKILAKQREKKQEKQQADAANQEKMAQDLQYEQNLFNQKAEKDKAQLRKEKEQKKQEAGEVLGILQKQERVTTKVEAQEKKATQEQIDKRDTVIDILQNNRNDGNK